MNSPTLKQIGDLRSEDFDSHPIWVACHVLDYDEPWYDETDEETVRPWTSTLPVDSAVKMLLVRAKAVFADGTECRGFLTPSGDTSQDLGVLQPRVFVGGGLFGFWGGMFGVPKEAREAFYRAVGKSVAAIFPIEISADPGLVRAECRAEVRGFYKSPDLKSVELEF